MAALAHQVGANQPPLLSSPARLPRSSSNARLLPAASSLGGRGVRLLPPRGARRAAAVRASSEAKAEAEAKPAEGAAEEERPYEEYEVTIEKPYGLKFSKGRDGGTYVEAILPGAAADKTGQFTVGDKVLATRLVRPAVRYCYRLPAFGSLNASTDQETISLCPMN